MAKEAGMDRENDTSGLNERVLAYQHTGEGLEELVRQLSARIYRYPRHRPGLDEDDCGEFYIYFYPRLIRTVENFREQGKPFEHYLNAVLRWQLQSYLRRKNRDKRSRALICRPAFWDQPGERRAAEDSPWDDVPGKVPPGEKQAKEDPRFPGVHFPDVPTAQAPFPFMGPGGVMKTDSDRRRFLLMLLKNMQFLDARELEMGFSFCGYPADELAAITAKLKERLAGKEARLAFLRTRRNRAFFKLGLLEEELSVTPEAAEKERLRACLVKTRATLRLAQQRLARTPRCPTNRDLAEVLDLPKGTVDTSLYWLKKRLLSVYAQHREDTKRYA
jgi:RNA polymerase sigma factor (sigma-70 family)